MRLQVSIELFQCDMSSLVASPKGSTASPGFVCFDGSTYDSSVNSQHMRHQADIKTTCSQFAEQRPPTVRRSSTRFRSLGRDSIGLNNVWNVAAPMPNTLSVACSSSKSALIETAGETAKSDYLTGTNCDFPPMFTTAAVDYFRSHQSGAALPFINSALDSAKLGSVQAEEIKRVAKRLDFRQGGNFNVALCLHELNWRDRVIAMTVDTRLCLLRGGFNFAEIILLCDQNY